MNLTGHGQAQGQAHAEGLKRDTDYKYPWHMDEIVVLDSSVSLINRGSYC